MVSAYWILDDLLPLFRELHSRYPSETSFPINCTQNSADYFGIFFENLFGIFTNSKDW